MTLSFFKSYSCTEIKMSRKWRSHTVQALNEAREKTNKQKQKR